MSIPDLEESIPTQFGTSVESLEVKAPFPAPKIKQGTTLTYTYHFTQCWPHVTVNFSFSVAIPQELSSCERKTTVRQGCFHILFHFYFADSWDINY
jgi:hypothetical protein